MKHPLSCPFTHPCAHYAQYLPIFADVGGVTFDKAGHSGLTYLSVYFFSWFRRDYQLRLFVPLVEENTCLHNLNTIAL
jgi:hypothetical protein